MQGFTYGNKKIVGRSLILPVGTAAQRPVTPEVGATRFNTTSGSLEVYNGLVWDTMALSGMVDVYVDSFTGDGSTTVFGSLTNQVDNATDILVFIGGVYQIPTTNYTVDGSYDITFVTAPPDGVSINVIQNFNSTTV